MLLLKAYRQPAEQDFVVAGGHGKAFKVYQGQFLTVIDVDGQQVGSFFAFNPSDLREYMSPHNTRLSNRRRTMLIMVRDTVGRHDLLLPACDPARYAAYGSPGHRSCTENAVGALRDVGVTVPRLYDPVNLFMNVGLDADQRLTIEPAASRGGDHVTFRIVMDSLWCVLSACPMDLNDCNAGWITACECTTSPEGVRRSIHHRGRSRL
jgi:uncharacterized protein